MGQNESSFKRTYNETVAELSTVQLQEITARFSKLYSQAGGSKGHVVDREAFAKYFNLPPTVGDRLFDAFDEKKNGKISFEEFVCGLAIVLHGSFHDRCSLLFHVFNLAGDEGVSREELTTMLSAILQSTDTILYTVCESGGAVLGSENRLEAVRIMVEEAFKNCDITGTGKLLPMEFEYWLKRNPKVLDSLLCFSTQEDECMLGNLIMTPSEQNVGIMAAGEQVGVASDLGLEDKVQESTDGAVTFEIHEEGDDVITDHTQSDDVTAKSKTADGIIDESSTADDITQTPQDESIDERAPVISEEYPGDDDQLASVWIPSVETQSLLSQDQVMSDHMTCPALGADLAMCDPLEELLTAHFPDTPRRTILSVDNVTMDVRGLRKLVCAGCFQSALDLTSRFLSAHGQGAGQSGPTLHTHKTLQMWSSRLSLMVYLGLYKEAETELEEFGELDNPDLYYQHHSHTYPGRKGSLVPFSMRLVHAVLPSLTSRPQLALDRLCTLKTTCTKIVEEVQSGRLPGVSTTLNSQDKEVALELWTNRLTRVLYYLGNALVSLADHHTASQVYKEIIPLSPADAPYIYSGLGRLYLTLGDLQTARDYFTKVEGLHGGDSRLVHINRALVNVSLSRWQAVRECLQTALTFDPSNLAIKSNLTVSTFYQGRLKESIEAMEELLTSDPPASLQSGLFANLAAAYELESGQSLGKKLNFVPLLGTHVCEGFQLQALNIR